jgi:hypothetical protein
MWVLKPAIPIKFGFRKLPQLAASFMPSPPGSKPVCSTTRVRDRLFVDDRQLTLARPALRISFSAVAAIGQPAAGQRRTSGVLESWRGVGDDLTI